MAVDPALKVPCPTCFVKKGQPCRSRRDVVLHQSRREAAADSRKPAPGKPERRTVLVGRTGEGNVIPETAEFWPPWEDPPVAGCLAESGIPVSGLVWCPVHREYEELRDGVPAVRLGGGW